MGHTLIFKESITTISNTMVEQKRLARPPIKEAIIDLKASLATEISIEKLEANLQDLKSVYPETEYLRQSEFGFQHLGDEFRTTQVHKGTVGLRLRSADNTRVVQFRRDGFTFSRLAPYQTWEEMREEAERLWGRFVKAGVPETVERVATRYINIIELPIPVENLSEYFTAPLQVPADLPQRIMSFFDRKVLHDDTIQAIAIVTQAFDSVVESKAPIALDIDVFKEAKYAVSAREYWGELETLRALKNRIFFGSITEKTVSMYL